MGFKDREPDEKEALLPGGGYTHGPGHTGRICPDWPDAGAQDSLRDAGNYGRDMAECGGGLFKYTEILHSGGAGQF